MALMNRALMTIAAAAVATVALSGLAATGAAAQPRGPVHGDPPHHAPHQPPHQPPHHAHPDRGGPPKAAAVRRWGPGDRLPPAYTAHRHIVANPGAHRLHRPPRGHHWVRAGSDAVLVVSRTGVVVQWLPGRFR